MKTESFADALYSRGKQARDAGDRQHAKSLWKEAVLAAPSNAQYHASLAYLFSDEDDFAQALPSWREAHKHNPGDARYANGLGSALHHLQHYNEASTYFRIAGELNPGNPMYKENLNKCLAAVSTHPPTPARPVPPQPGSSTSSVRQRSAANESMRQTFRAKEEVLRRTAMPNIYTDGQFDGTGYDGMHFNGMATNAARAQARQAYARNMVAEDFHCNDDGNHQVQKFSFFEPDNYPAFPMVMRRRGVPKEMYDADLAGFKGEIKRTHEDFNVECAAALFTCAVAMCFMKDSTAKNIKRMRPIIDEMNQRWMQYGITWNYTVIRGVGSYVSYET